MARQSTKSRHRLPTTVEGYEELLIEKIKERTQAEFDEFLLPQVSACAQTWAMTAKIHKTLIDAKNLTSIVTGSTGQQKEDVNPLLPYYLKLQAELRLQLEALGLNYKATPSKIKEDTHKGVDKSDKMAEFYTNAKQ